MTKRRFKRVYHHMDNMEEFHSPMWMQIPVDDRQAAIECSANLMRDNASFYIACVKAIRQWPNSAEANLTASVINHQAWIGHASCCINHGASEDLTRLAWRTLTSLEQDAANEAADKAIQLWSDEYAISNPQNVKRQP